MFQTDVFVDPSNSGGALVDLRGRLIGIPALVARQTGVNSGIGLPVRLDALRAVLPRLARGEAIRAGFLRVILASEGSEGRGAIVETVIDGTPAARAGLAPGDAIESIDGRRSTEPPPATTS